MTRVSITRNILIRDPLAGLPASGEALLVASSGSHQSIRPETHLADRWTKALFEAYGSGTFVSSYSDDGAYVIAGSGGHNHYEIRGGAIFDWSALDWVYLAPIGVSETPSYTSEADTNGPPYWEITGTQVPAPAHPYTTLCEITTANGGGAKGSVIYVTRHAIGEVGNKYSPVAHRFDLATGQWSRISTNLKSLSDPIETGTNVLYDSIANHYYIFDTGTQVLDQWRYLDGADWTFKTLSSGGYASGSTGSVSWSLCHHAGYRLLVLFWGTKTQILDLDNPVSGWTTVAYSGSPPQAGKWVWHPAQGVFYNRPSSGAGQTLNKLVPASDPFSGTWAFSTVTLTGHTVPEYIGASVSTSAYGALHYIPSFQMLGWVTAFGIAILNP